MKNVGVLKLSFASCLHVLSVAVGSGMYSCLSHAEHQMRLLCLGRRLIN